MRIVTFSKKVDLNFGSATHTMVVSIDPFKPYVMPDAFFSSVANSERLSPFLYKVSDYKTRRPQFHTLIDKPGSNILIYNGSGGFGDQIMTWPLLNILHKRGYNVSVMFDPGNHFCYYGIDFLKSSHVSILQKNIVDMYDAVLLMDTVANADEHKDQLHPVDIMLNLVGIDPDSVVPTDKVFRPNFYPNELDEASKVHHNVLGNSKFILFQTDTSSITRRMSEEAVFRILKDLADEFTDYKILCIGDFRDRPNMLKYLYKDVSSPEKLHDINNVKDPRLIPYRAYDLRVLWALAAKAECIVGYDSMMAHVSGSFGYPCVSMWGPIDPEKRIKYYTDAYPLSDVSACPHGHCFHAKKEFPPYCPTGNSTGCCALLSGIGSNEIIGAINRIFENQILPKVIDYEF